MIVLGLALALPLGAIAAEAESKKFTLISVIFDGTKVWLPSTLIVHEGDQPSTASILTLTSAGTSSCNCSVTQGSPGT